MTNCDLGKAVARSLSAHCSFSLFKKHATAFQPFAQYYTRYCDLFMNKIEALDKSARDMTLVLILQYVTSKLQTVIGCTNHSITAEMSETVHIQANCPHLRTAACLPLAHNQTPKVASSSTFLQSRAARKKANSTANKAKYVSEQLSRKSQIATQIAKKRRISRIKREPEQPRWKFLAS